MESKETEGQGLVDQPTPEQTKTAMEKVEMMRAIASAQSVQPSGMFSFHTHYDMVRQFHAGAQGKGLCHLGVLGKLPPSLEVLRNRCEVLKEEFSEHGGISLLESMASGEKPLTLENMAVLLDWICDMNYFMLGLAANLGLPYDTAFMYVQKANMRKVIRPGGAIFREDGKVLKPEGWKGPNKEIFEAVVTMYKEATTLDPHQKPGMPAH